MGSKRREEELRIKRGWRQRHQSFLDIIAIVYVDMLNASSDKDNHVSLFLFFFWLEITMLFNGRVPKFPRLLIFLFSFLFRVLICVQIPSY